MTQCYLVPSPLPHRYLESSGRAPRTQAAPGAPPLLAWKHLHSCPQGPALSQESGPVDHVLSMRQAAARTGRWEQGRHPGGGFESGSGLVLCGTLSSPQPATSAFSSCPGLLPSELQKDDICPFPVPGRSPPPPQLDLKALMPTPASPYFLTQPSSLSPGRAMPFLPLSLCLHPRPFSSGLPSAPHSSSLAERARLQ